MPSHNDDTEVERHTKWSHSSRPRRVGGVAPGGTRARARARDTVTAPGQQRETGRPSYTRRVVGNGGRWMNVERRRLTVYRPPRSSAKNCGFEAGRSLRANAVPRTGKLFCLVPKRTVTGGQMPSPSTSALRALTDCCAEERQSYLEIKKTIRHRHAPSPRPNRCRFA